MIISNIKTINSFSKNHPQSRAPLAMWVEKARKGTWRNPAEVKKEFASVDFLSHNRLIFNIGGNKYRLYIEAVYENEMIVILGVYTHAEYSKKQF